MVEYLSYLDYMMQVAAYSNAVNWMYGDFYNLEVAQAKVVVALDKDKAQVFTLDKDRLESMFHAFLLRLREFRTETH